MGSRTIRSERRVGPKGFRNGKEEGADGRNRAGRGCICMQTRLNWTLRRDREPTATGCLSARADLSMCIGRASHQSHLSVSRASRLCWNEVMLGHCHDDRQYRLSPRCRSPSGGRTASRRYTLIRSYEHTVGESPVQGSAYRAKHVSVSWHDTDSEDAASCFRPLMPDVVKHRR